MAVTKARSNAVAKAAKGDLSVGSGTNASSILAVGTDAQILVADSTASTGLKWATPTSSGSITLLSTTALSGATTTISGISQSYTHLIVRIYNTDMSSNATINVGTVDTSLNTYSLNGAMPSVAGGTGTVEYQGPLLGKTVRAAGTNNINAVITFPFYSTAYGSGNGGPMWTSVGQIYDNAGQAWIFNGGGTNSNVTNSTDAIYFGVSTGTWSAGTVKIYGVN